MVAPKFKKTSSSSSKHDSEVDNKNESSRTTNEVNESQLSQTLDLLKAGPQKVISPATHLLRKARVSVSRKNNERREPHTEVTSDLDDEETLSSPSESDSFNLANKGNPHFLNKSASSSTHIDSKSSLFKRGSSNSIPSPRKLTVTSQNALHRTLSPIRSGVSLVGSSVNIKPKSTPETDFSLDERAQHITRSFANYITAASVFAGFEGLENDEDENGTLILTKDGSGDSKLMAPDNVVKLKDSESTDDTANDSDEEASNSVDIGTNDNSGSDGNDDDDSIITNSTVTNTVDTLMAKHNKAEILRVKNELYSKHSLRNRSQFELSVVQRMIDHVTSPDQKDNVFKKATIVTKRLKEVFHIDEKDNLLGDYPCWLMGDVLLQGHLYITDKKILFFAYLPKRKKNAVVKSGGMSVKSYPSMRMHRKWLILREHTVSIYASSTDLYFPQLVIDLRTALRAETYGSSKDSDPTTPVWVSIVTETKTYWFQAENLDTAKSWVTALKKQIFSSRNKGDEVAIEIPLQNVIDLEISNVFVTTKSLKIKIIENPETFAIDDYYVMFFSQGKDAADCIKEAIENAGLEISLSTDSTNEDWKNSDLIKSKIELLKTTSSSVKSTNFNLTENDDSLDVRNILMSSDEDDSDDDHNGATSFIKKMGYSTGKKLTKNLIPHIRMNRRSSTSNHHDSVDSMLDTSKSRSYESEGDIPEDDSISNLPDDDISVGDQSEGEKYESDEESGKKWSAKYLAHGITNFTSSLLFSGPPQHYDDTLAISKEGQDPYFIADKKKRESAEKRFIKRFSLSDSERLLATYSLYLMKGLPVYGKLYIGSTHICFRSTLPRTNTIMILPLSDTENVSKESGFRFGYCGLVLVIKGHEELFFEFSNSTTRDDCEMQLLKQIEQCKVTDGKDSVPDNSNTEALNSAKLQMFENKLNSDTGMDIPIIVEDHPFEKTNIKPSKSYRFTLLTIGSRGDVQPYIALGKFLMKEGHTVKIVTHSEFKDWVESYGIGFDCVAGDPSALMALMVSNPNINYSFIKEAKAKFREWIDDLLISSWNACQDCDVLIESPSSISGIHIAEKLQIPYFRAFTMPWTRTRAYPHAFLVPDQKLGGAYNYMTHVAFENGYWRGTCNQVNKWRVETLKLPKTNLGAMHQNSVPLIYNISPVVFPPSIDFPDWVKVSGYWFLDEKNNYQPPQKLVEFIEKARRDGKKLVYIGFGSIVVEDPKELTKAVVDAVVEADVRCILNKGWSDRLNSKDKGHIEIDLPPQIYNSGNVPHDWLFTQIDAAVHHGGSGTTGASLRFGLPTVIKPFFGDQKFYGSRVEDMGVGIALKDLNSKSLSKALKEVTTNTRIIAKAKFVGEQIMKENGVQNAVDYIYTLMEYARKLSVSKNKHDLADSDEDDDDLSIDLPKMHGSWLLV
ncbi:hypothetical protein CANINC_002767 [Pichia inconspicua]|uniref:Sterol 3-beta-glucosyltransferase n=1 Tax=Pichia inconspicua TaxID=52247 RepID=A0A4T0X1K2_9ASCO|nr:hypothetical protein CANINC_002767 [[Candida] inconspicua]